MPPHPSQVARFFHHPSQGRTLPFTDRSQQVHDPAQPDHHIGDLFDLFPIQTIHDPVSGQQPSQDTGHPDPDIGQMGKCQDMVRRAHDRPIDQIDQKHRLDRSQILFLAVGLPKKVQHHQRTADPKKAVTSAGYPDEQDAD